VNAVCEPLKILDELESLWMRTHNPNFFPLEHGQIDETFMDITAAHVEISRKVAQFSQRLRAASGILNQAVHAFPSQSSLMNLGLLELNNAMQNLYADERCVIYHQICFIEYPVSCY